jgi:hypothetical protein
LTGDDCAIFLDGSSSFYGLPSYADLQPEYVQSFSSSQSHLDPLSLGINTAAISPKEEFQELSLEFL